MGRPVVTIEGDGELEGTLFMALGMIVANWSQLSFISRPDVLVSESCLSSQMLASKVRFRTCKKCYHFLKNSAEGSQWERRISKIGVRVDNYVLSWTVCRVLLHCTLSIFIFSFQTYSEEVVVCIYVNIISICMILYNENLWKTLKL